MLLGICGGSCSGKTTLIKALKKRYSKSVTFLSFDEYFIGTEKLKDKVVTDWESPILYNYSAFVSDLSKLKQDETVEIECHSRESSERGIKNLVIKPRGIIIVEGFLIFHTSKARKLFDELIFIDIPEKEMIKRRVARIKTNQGWDSVEYIKTKLIPGHRT